MKHEPGQSILHRLHPVVKLGWLLWITLAVFVFGAAEFAVGVVVFEALLFAVIGRPPWRVRGLRAWVALAAVVGGAHVFIMREGGVIIGPITAGGVYAGVRAAGRLLAVILGSGLFVVTTDPYSFAGSLMRVGFPDRWGFALITALRLAPIFRLEAGHIYRAQWVRGVAYDTSGVRRWWLILRHLSLPLLVSALRTAQSLSLSMEGRGFGAAHRRTHLHEAKTTSADWIAGIILAGLLVGAVCCVCAGIWPANSAF